MGVPQSPPVVVDDSRMFVLEGRVICHHARFVGLFRDRAEGALAACQQSPALLREVGGSWAVFALEGQAP